MSDPGDAPPEPAARVAVVDDERAVGEVLGMLLRRAGHEVAAFARARGLLDALDAGEVFDLVLTDLRMPDLDGLGLLAELRGRLPHVPVVLVTAHGSVSSAVEAVRAGAYDYVEKPFDNDACRALVARALAHSRLGRENARLRDELRTRFGLDRIVARSGAMAAVLERAHRAAASNATVLVTGESGTGKEVVARALHLQSPRVGGPFEAVNVKALASGVVESELFGHAKGAFTGADRARAGLFERAGGGTVFLDEIGEIDGGLQAKLLRVLQEREVQPVGGDRAVAVDVRVVAATHRDLAAAVAAGDFREDLYYRLAVIPIHIPPLRERRADVLPLARSFLERLAREHGRAISGWSEEAGRWMLEHPWPGNVRELENTLERGVVLARGEVLELEDLRVGPPRAAGADPGTLQDALDAAAVARIRAALEAAGGVRVEAARALGIERTTLYRLMKRYGIEG